MLETLGTTLALVCGIVSVVCYILMLVQMFQHRETTVGIFCIVLLGFGALLAFGYGWTKAGEWGIIRLMTFWTIFLFLNVILLIFNLSPLWTELY